MLTMWI